MQQDHSRSRSNRGEWNQWGCSALGTWYPSVRIFTVERLQNLDHESRAPIWPNLGYKGKLSSSRRLGRRLVRKIDWRAAEFFVKTEQVNAQTLVVDERHER